MTSPYLTHPPLTTRERQIRDILKDAQAAAEAPRIGCQDRLRAVSVRLDRVLHILAGQEPADG